MIKLSNIFKESLNPNVYQIQAKLVVNTEERPMSDVLSDIRAIQGITIVDVTSKGGKTVSPRHVVDLSLKIDPAPFSPFNKDEFKNILLSIKKIPAVLTAKFTSQPLAV